jgi:hypothetical protein
VDNEKAAEYLRVDIGPEKQVVGVKREWLAYSPETLINRYGRPSRVVFALDWGPRSFFDMVMYFRTQDLIVEYAGYDVVPWQQGVPWVCPTNLHYDTIRIWMGKNPVYPPSGGSPVDQATYLSIDSFSALMLGDSDKACFPLNLEVFP